MSEDRYTCPELVDGRHVDGFLIGVIDLPAQADAQPADAQHDHDLAQTRITADRRGANERRLKVGARCTTCRSPIPSRGPHLLLPDFG